MKYSFTTTLHILNLLKLHSSNFNSQDSIKKYVMFKQFH